MGLFSADIHTMDDLFLHTLQDIYYAENQIVKALPEMIEKATDKQSGPALSNPTSRKPRARSSAWHRCSSCSARSRRASTVRRSTA